MKYRPVQDRIIIKVKITDETEGGIVLTGEARIKEQIAEVLAVGPGVWHDKGFLIPMKVKVGDMVTFPRFTGNKLDGDIWQLRQSEVLAVVS